MTDDLDFESADLGTDWAPTNDQAAVLAGDTHQPITFEDLSPFILDERKEDDILSVLATLTDVAGPSSTPFPSHPLREQRSQEEWNKITEAVAAACYQRKRELEASGVEVTEETEMDEPRHQYWMDLCIEADRYLHGL